MRVALDLEEVLADTISECCASTDSLSIDDFQSWDIRPGHTWQVYAGVSDALWRHDPLSIPPVEPDLDGYTNEIWSEVETLDVVTARQHVDESIELWLARNNIQYDNLLSTDAPKYEYDYDLYIDDNPEMVGHCRLLLRHHPHNSGIDTESRKSCDRIHSLEEVLDFV